MMHTPTATRSPFVTVKDIEEYWERGYWISPKLIFYFFM